MGSAVVRCTTCQGASQVEAEAIGLTVRCPRCDATFIAIEEVEAVPPPRARRNPTLSMPEPRRDPRPERSRRRRERVGEPERDRRDREPESLPDHHEHDPHREPPGTLPASVLIGLALLPFVIPIFWLIAPAVVGKAPAMSIATPSALALSASILCLAVIYTVDWTAATRIKGVLMLVCLAYFGALSLYFVKKELVEKARRFAGMEEKVHWEEYRTDGYHVTMPANRQAVQEANQPIRSIKLDYHEAYYDQPIVGRIGFVAGAGALADKADKGGPRPGTDAWFDQIMQEIVTRSNGKGLGQTQNILHHDFFPGRQLKIALPEQDGFVRIVRVFLIKGKLYYLSAEGFALDPNDTHARIFFQSFRVPSAEN